MADVRLGRTMSEGRCSRPEVKLLETATLSSNLRDPRVRCRRASELCAAKLVVEGQVTDLEGLWLAADRPFTFTMFNRDLSIRFAPSTVSKIRELKTANSHP